MIFKHKYKIFTVLFLLVGLLLGSITLSTSVSASTPNIVGDVINTADKTPTEINEIDKAAETLKIKELTKNELEARILELRAKNESLELEITDLENQERELIKSIENLNDSLTKSKEINTGSQSEDIEEQKNTKTEEIKAELDQANLNLLGVQKLLGEKRAEFEGNITKIEDARTTLSEKEQEVDVERQNLRVVVLNTSTQYLIYALWFFGYYLAYALFIWINRRFVRPNSLQFILGSIIRIVFAIVVLVTLVFIFAGNLSAILTVLSLASAALVVALQDFVSSFFAWIFVRSKNKYQVGDVIRIAGSQSYFFGKVLKIEVFRTVLQERMGDGDYNGNINKEQLTGKTVSFPNNIIMKEPVVNYTADNRVLWHNFSVTITFDSDFEVGDQVLNEVMNTFFNEEYLLQNRIPKNYHPKVTMHIADSGVTYTIWFPAKIGTFKDTLDGISKLVLKSFRENNIELAYNTYTVTGSINTNKK